MFKSIWVICGCVLVGMAGCQTGVGIMTYEKGNPPVVAQATVDGEYALYESNGMDPKVSYFLKRGDPLGFKTGKTGEIIAVAGTAEVSEPDAGYVWRRRTGQENQPSNNPFATQNPAPPAPASH